MNLRPTLALLTLAGLLPCQDPVLLGASAPGAPLNRADPWVTPTQRPWPSNVARGGRVHQVLNARLTGHLLPDVILLDGNQPLLVTAPGIHTSFGPLPRAPGNPPLNDVRDLAVLVGQGVADGSNTAHDALALARPTGLFIWRRAADGNTTEAKVGGAEWNNAQLLATHPADSSLLFGVDGSGTVHVAQKTGVNYVTLPYTFTARSAPLAISCIQWASNTNGPSVAILTATGVKVFDRLGAPLTTIAANTTQGSLTLVRAASYNTEWLAWLTPGATSTLRICQPGSQQNISLPGRFVGATAAEWTEDGAQELMLTDESNLFVTMLCNQFPASNVPFAYSQATALRFAIAETGQSAGVLNQANIAAGDLDGDGDGDLLAVVDTGTTSSQLTIVKASTYNSPSMVVVNDIFGWDVPPGYEFDVHFIRATGGTHTHVSMWTQLTVNGTEQLVPTGQSQLVAHNSGLGNLVTLQASREHLLQGGRYVLKLTPVEIVNGQVVDVAKAAILSLYHDGPLPYQTRNVDGGVIVPGVPRPEIPPTPPGEPPTPE